MPDKRAAEAMAEDASGTTAPPQKKTKYNSMLTIWVGTGEDKQEFIVHETVATLSSKFMRAAIKPEWKGGQQKTIEIPEHSPLAFGCYLDWLYAGSKDTPPYDRNYAVFQRYILAQYLQDTRFGNAQIDSLLIYFEGRRPKGEAQQPPAKILEDSIALVWERTLAGCGLRRLLLRRYAARWHRGHLDSPDNCLSAVPAEFWQELCRELLPAERSRLEPRISVRPTFADRCEFHEHEEGEPRCT